MDTSFDFENFENITMRKKYISLSSESLKSFETSHSDYLARSLPDISTVLDENKLCELREEIKLLKTQLESAHAEIENLSLENSSLKKLVVEQQSTITQYKSIFSGSPDLKNSLRKKKGHRKSEIPPLTHTIITANSEPSINSDIPLNTEPSLNSQKELRFDDPLIRGLPTNIDDSMTITKDGADRSFTQQTLTNSLIPNDPSLTKNRNIYIVGTQQCKGLTLQLIKTRKNSITKCQDYFISSLIKPTATSNEILKSTPMFQSESSTDNYLILCVGENDENPTSLLINLCIMLNNCKNLHVIVLSVYKNKYLNENMLNYTLKNICKSFPNCTFIKSRRFSSKRIYLNDLCNQINMIIDTKDYNDNYLLYNKKINCTKSHLEVTSYRKGTIPYYFPIISTKKSSYSNKNKPSEKLLPRFFHKPHK